MEKQLANSGRRYYDSANLRFVCFQFMQNSSANQGALDIGEHFLSNLVFAMIAERHPEESPIRKGLEACVKKELPIVFQEGNSSGDIIGALKRWVARLEMILSQMEAERGLEERATGITAPERRSKKPRLPAI
jgi:hypothetical protein